MHKLLRAAAVALGALAVAAPAALADQQIVVGTYGLWQFENTGKGAGGFVSGPDGVPLGQGSYRLNTSTNPGGTDGGHLVYLPIHLGLNLSRVERLQYSALSLGGASYPALELDLDGPDDQHVTTLRFQPPGEIGAWQRWDATDLPYWTSTAPIPGAEVPGAQTSLSALQGANPRLHLGMRGIGIRVQAAAAQIPYEDRTSAFVDAVRIGIVDPRGGRVWRMYDFEGLWDWQQPF
jgi:hypothetical protein